MLNALTTKDKLIIGNTLVIILASLLLTLNLFYATVLALFSAITSNWLGFREFSGPAYAKWTLGIAVFLALSIYLIRSYLAITP